MSWSAGVKTPTKASEIDEAIDACPTVPEEDGLDEHVKEAIGVAREAAKQIIASGAVGPIDGETEASFTVALNGHSNEGHEPADGWANDCMTVVVTQQ